MKIDPVTFEVDASGGTRPVYVWEAPVRVWHWLMAVAMFAMIITGYLIGRPLVSNLGDTWITYDFGYVRMVHFAAGLFFTALFIYRLFWVAVGNRYARMIFFPPLLSMKWWKGVFAQVAYYLFMRKSAPEYAGHNPLAQLAMFAMFVLGSFVIIITGLALYAQSWGWDTSWRWWWKGVFAQVAYYLFMRKSAPEYAGHNPLAQLAMFAMFVLGSFVIIITGLALYAQSWGWDTSWMAWFGWVFVLFGDAQAVRTVHHVMMYVFILFSIAHIYMSFREDVMGGATTLSSMSTGLRMFKEDHHG